MKVWTITTPNAKGQIVIPKQVRDALGITTSTPLNIVKTNGGIHIYPVEEVIAKVEHENSYTEILKRTQGAWAGDDWEKTEKRRRRIELEASRKRKQW